MTSVTSKAQTIRTRLRRYWLRHRTLFWTLHSLWALAVGAVVIRLARERYGFVPWAVLFLVLAWSSTMFFGRRFAAGRTRAGRSPAPGLRTEVTSYLTRTMYQETLFFLLPFYWYSTVIHSPNVVFSALLVGLAVFSCVDLVFDRWLRTRPLFGLVYFATVAFAAVNLLLPMLLPVDPAYATPIAALLAVGSAIPLAARGAMKGRKVKIGLGLLGVAFLSLVVGFPRLIAPVPLRLQHAVFASDIDRTTLVPADTLGPTISQTRLHGRLFVLVEVFAPSNLPARVRLDWKRNGMLFHSSREVEIMAHDLGFRVWDGYRPETGSVPVGHYEVVLTTEGKRIVGRTAIDVRASSN